MSLQSKHEGKQASKDAVALMGDGFGGTDTGLMHD